MARRSARRAFGGGWGPWDASEQEPRPRQSELQRELGRAPAPVSGQGRQLSRTFWGRAWCANLERYRDYASRLPRGRTYLRQGAVLDLAIARGRITALVMGTSLYRVRIEITPVDGGRWSALRGRCEGKLSSLIDLLEGRVSDDVMKAVTEPSKGLFPEPREIRLTCSCPDWATMCKHVAAVLYGVGVRLDERPQLLFELRGVDPKDMVGAPAEIVGAVGGAERLDDGLSEIFGVDIQGGGPAAAKRPAVAKRRKEAAAVVMTRKQLLAHGVPASTLQGWLRRRILVSTTERGSYVLTDEARACLEWYG